MRLFGFHAKAGGRALLLLALFAFLFSGCAAGHYRRVAPDLSNPTRTVAVLPIYNVTTDLGGPEYIRELVTAEFEAMQYNVMSVKDVNSVLINRMGIVLGTQLEMTTPQVVGEILGVDALIYGYLLDFDDIMLGIYNARVVRGGFKMIDSRSGALLWSGGIGVKFIVVSGGAGIVTAIGKELLDGIDGLSDFETIEGLDEIKGLGEWVIIPLEVERPEDAALLTLGAMLVGKALGVHLHYEAGVMVRESMRGLPPGPGR